MIKRVFPVTLAFDCEWVPDPATIRRAFSLPATQSDADCIEHARAEVRSSDEDRQPYLKVVLCQIVSICAVVRRQLSAAVEVKLVVLPPLSETANWNEARILRSFLNGVGKNGAQLVGYNCLGSDLPAITQRALVNKLAVPEFGKRPEKPWEGTDYFSPFSDQVFDIGKTISFGRQMPTLHQAATACGIPGKLDVSGAQVADMWAMGRHQEIIQYNVFDALTTYLLWLRCAYFTGVFTDQQYAAEQQQVRDLLDREIASGHVFLCQFVKRWKELSEPD